MDRFLIVPSREDVHGLAGSSGFRQDVLERTREWPVVILDMRKVDFLTTPQIAGLLELARARKTVILAGQKLSFIMKAIHADALVMVFHSMEELEASSFSRSVLN